MTIFLLGVIFGLGFVLFNHQYFVYTGMTELIGGGTMAVSFIALIVLLHKGF